MRTTRAATEAPSAEHVRSTVPKRMGVPRMPLDKALQVAAQLEDEEIVRKLALGK